MTGAASMPDPWRRMHVVALRKARCETQAELAEAAEVAEHSVWMWESGRRTPTRPSIVRRLNGLLESLTPAQRECYDHELGRLEEAGGTPAAQASPLPGDAPPAAKEQTDVNRRDALEVIAVALAAGSTGGFQWDRHAAPTTIDAGLVADYEQSINALTSVYVKGNLAVLLPAATAFADGLAPLKRAPTHELGLRLAAVSVDAHAMAGLLAFKAGDRLLTQRHLVLASHVASFCGDPILKARAWALEAKHLYSPLPDGQGSARHAVALVGRARALARHADGHTRAWLAASLAEEAAELGDVGLCEWAVEEAGHAIGTTVSDASGFFSPQGYYGLTEVYVQGVYGRVAGLAGRLDEAERFVSDEITLAQNSGQRYLALCHLGTVRVENAEPEGACAVLVEAGDQILMECPSKIARVRAVRQRMDPAWNDLACVRELDERLRVAA